MEDLTTSPPTSINPYETLNLSKTATASQIKSAYRKAALKHHPDKAPPSSKSTAHTKFQEIAFAYAILSSPRLRSRYDTTGQASSSLDLSDDDEDFNWSEFYSEQYGNIITSETLERFKEEYKGSEEEKHDLLIAYMKFEGDLDAVFEEVLLSSPGEDEDRFRKIIQQAIEDGIVEAYDKFTKESKSKRKRRLGNSKREEEEAKELAQELGIADKLFGNEITSKDGNKKGTKKIKEANNETALAALIQQRQKGRSESFLDNLEAKYTGGSTRKRNSKSVDEVHDEPSEEAFQNAASRLKGAKKGSKLDAKEDVNGDGTAKRRSKRAKK
ncbi:MAG: hypothetical protein M1812_005220 [Candelaria pacifica]|nr:MAG: hypothetical protein M1812_005220 [Candelaria pacifica]